MKFADLVEMLKASPPEKWGEKELLAVYRLAEEEPRAGLEPGEWNRWQNATDSGWYPTGIEDCPAKYRRAYLAEKAGYENREKLSDVAEEAYSRIFSAEDAKFLRDRCGLATIEECRKAIAERDEEKRKNEATAAKRAAEAEKAERLRLAEACKSAGRDFFQYRTYHVQLDPESNWGESSAKKTEVLLAEEITIDFLRQQLAEIGEKKEKRE